MKARIFNVCHATPLMVVQHLRCHLPFSQAQEFLIWHPLDNSSSMDAFMRQVIATANFTDVLDIRHFKSFRPRIHGSATWWLESARRLRKDAMTVRRWMNANGITEEQTELWTEDPIHFNTFFARALFTRARHVKFPHCFYLEDADGKNLKLRLELPWMQASFLKRFFYWRWLRLASGLDFSDQCTFDRGYTFDQPTPWTDTSIDVSKLISMDAFRDTYATLPITIRQSLEQELEPIRLERKPLVLLLLFGLGPEMRQLYQNSISQIISEHKAELGSFTLAVKSHPAAKGCQENLFFDWLKSHVSGTVFQIRSVLNLEFILPQIRPDFVLAGPCGAMPIVRQLRAGRPIALREIVERIVKHYPAYREEYDIMLRDIDVW